MPLILPARTLDSGFNIDNSLRFNRSDSAYLSRTTGSDGNKRTWTWSAWIKRSNVNSSTMGFFAVEIGGGGQLSFLFNNSGSNNELDVQENVSGVKWRKITNQVFRDPSAWYHIVLAFDSTQGTASNRLKLYVNGSQVTSFSTDTNPDQNYDSILTTASSPTNIGKYSNHYFDGYMSDVYLIDGSALAPTEFGETDDNGVWIPKKANVSYGTNGFKLEYKQSGTGTDASGMGADTSGNGNHFAVNNLTALDQTTDTPTNNFATMNPLDSGSGSTFSEGNLATNTDDNKNDIATMGFQNGKWYWETKCAGSGIVGVNHESIMHLNNSNQNDDVGSVAFSTYHGTIFHNNNSDTTPPNDRDGQIIGCAVDMDNDKIYWHVDGTYISTTGGQQAPSGTNGITIKTGTTSDGFYFPKLSSGTTSQTMETNFGNPSFSISSGNADANGYGNFEYAVPSGYYALCTKNLAEYG